MKTRTNLIASRVSVDGHGPFDCFVEVDRPEWNGYARPWFTKEQAEAVLGKLRSSVHWDYEGWTWGFAVWDRKDLEDDEFTEPAEVVEEWRGVKFLGEPSIFLYPIGAGEWCWVEAESPASPSH